MFRESLRLYPPVWALARIATRPYELGAYAVPEGGTIVMSQWVVHRDPRYFPDPLRFPPERWLDGPAPPPGAYFPFAAGPRMCIGERFAMLEGTLVLAAIGGRGGRAGGRAPPLDARFTLRPHGGLARSGTGCVSASAGLAARLESGGLVITSELVPRVRPTRRRSSARSRSWPSPTP